MKRRWLMSAIAALAVSTGAAPADEKAPEGERPAASAPAAPAAPEQPEESPETEGPASEGPEPGAGTELPAQVAQATQPTTPAPPPPAATPGPPPVAPVDEAPPPRFRWCGQTDFYFVSNFNDPWTGRNALRAWDIKDEQGPHLGLIEIWGEYARDPVGFRVDLNFGPTARLNNLTEFSDDKWLQYFQQLYVSVNLNRSGSTYLDFGKYVTPIGAEVIEPAGNWFYSQGVMFTWPIPFWHFGGRLYHYLNDTDYLMFHVNNGWGTVTQPPGAGPNFGLTGSKVFSPLLTLTGNYLGGDNSAGLNDPSWRHLFNAVVSYKPSEASKLTYLFDNTLGIQTNFRDGAGPSEDAWWYGIQAMAKYDIRPDQYVAFRAEYLHDGEGVLFGDDLDVYTLALNYTKIFNKYFQTRVEYRHDFAGGGRPFADSRRGTFTSDQPTFIISAIVTY